MKRFIMLAALLISTVANASPDGPAVKDYLRGKGTRYIVRFWEQRDPGSSKEWTVACFEGLLENDIEQNPKAEYDHHGSMWFKHGPLAASLSLDTETHSTLKRSSYVVMSAFYHPPKPLDKGVGYGIGSMGTDIYSSDFSEMIGLHEGIYENGRAYQEYSEPNPVKKLGVSLNINYPKQFDCAYFKSKSGQW